MRIEEYDKYFRITQVPDTDEDLWKDLVIGDLIMIEYRGSYVSVQFPREFMDYMPVDFNEIIQMLEDNGMKYEEIGRDNNDR